MTYFFKKILPHNKKIILGCFTLLLCNNSCTETVQVYAQPENHQPYTEQSVFLQHQEHPLNEKMERQGLVNIEDFTKEMTVDIKYASEDNFMNQNLYGEGFEGAYVQKAALDKLLIAQETLQNVDSTLSLIIYDSARPNSVQQKMWELVKGTDQQQYVASPYGGGSIHNYGCAIDLSIIRENGEVLDMGTPFDHFGPEAQPRYNYTYLEQGILTQEHIDNRLLLRKVMREAGFLAIDSEWWHFNAFSKEYVRATYQMIE